MTTVVDASVVVKWLVEEPGSEAAASLLARDDLVAPSLCPIEVVNALWRRRRADQLTKKEYVGLIEEVARLPVSLLDDSTLLSGAASLAADLDHPIYDCLYLEAARRNEGILITADRRLVAVAHSKRDLRAHVQLLIQSP
jgi:predicted nucleic acid-binding protein